MDNSLDDLIKKIEQRQKELDLLSNSDLSNQTMVLPTFLHQDSDGQTEEDNATFAADNKKVFETMHWLFKISGDHLK